MSKQLIVNSIPFDYPTAGEDPGWGSDATGWAEEVTGVLANIQGPDDILETAFTVANNQVAGANVTALVFNGGSCRAAVITYSIYRRSNTNTSGKAETGTINILYDNSAVTPWSLSQGDIVGDSGVTFTITNGGQFQYTSTDIGAAGYTGLMKFKASTLAQ